MRLLTLVFCVVGVGYVSSDGHAAEPRPGAQIITDRHPLMLIHSAPVTTTRTAAPPKKPGLQLKELRQAVNQLEQCGFAEQAAQLQRLIADIEVNASDRLAAKSQELHRLQQEIRALQELTGESRMITIRCQILYHCARFVELEGTGASALRLLIFVLRFAHREESALILE
jgi:hypothetical protein